MNAPPAGIVVRPAAPFNPRTHHGADMPEPIASEREPEQRLQMPLDGLVAGDVEMLSLERGERDAVVSCIQAAMVQVAIVAVDRAKARIELNGLVANLVVWRVNDWCERGLDQMQGSIKQDGDCPIDVWTDLERYRAIESR